MIKRTNKKNSKFFLKIEKKEEINKDEKLK